MMHGLVTVTSKLVVTDHFKSVYSLTESMPALEVIVYIPVWLMSVIWIWYAFALNVNQIGFVIIDPDLEILTI